MSSKIKYVNRYSKEDRRNDSQVKFISKGYSVISFIPIVIKFFV